MEMPGSDVRIRGPTNGTRNNNSSVIGMRLNINGLTIIDSTAAATMTAYWSESSSPRPRPAWPTMKLNSPIWLSPAATTTSSRPAFGIRTESPSVMVVLPTTTRTASSSTWSNCSRITSTDTCIPTDTKNKTAKRSRNGPTSTSI